MRRKGLVLSILFCGAVLLTGCGRSMKDPVLRQAELMARSAARMDAEEFNEHVDAESAELSAIFAKYKPDKDSKDDLKIVTDKLTDCIRYDVYDDSFSKNLTNTEFTVDIKLGVPDCYNVLGNNKTYRNGEHAASLISLSSNQVTYPITMKFKKSGDDIVLTNPEDLVEVYEYTKYKDIKFAGNFPDIIKESSFEGLNDKGIYYNSRSIVLNVKLDEAAKETEYSYSYDIVFEDEKGKVSDLIKDKNGSVEKSDVITISYKDAKWLENGKYTVRLRDEYGTQTEYSVEAKRLSDQRYKYFIEPEDGLIIFPESENVVYRIPGDIDTKPLDDQETKLFSQVFYRPYDLEYFGYSKDKSKFVFSVHLAYVDKDPIDSLLETKSMKKGDIVKDMPLELGSKTLKSCNIALNSTKNKVFFRVVMVPVPGEKYCHLVYIATLKSDKTEELTKGFELN